MIVKSVTSVSHMSLHVIGHQVSPTRLLSLKCALVHALGHRRTQTQNDIPPANLLSPAFSYDLILQTYMSCWDVGSKRPIYEIRNAYPRYVHTADENIHGPDYLLGEQKA
jgi:hypothetical protein